VCVRVHHVITQLSDHGTLCLQILDIVNNSLWMEQQLDASKGK